MRIQVLTVINLRTKLAESSFTRPRDMTRAQNKNRSRDSDHAPFGVVCHR